MIAFAPRAAVVPHHFEVAENDRGYWVASEQDGLVGGVFRTQKDALRFAVFEAGGDSACVRLLAGNPSGAIAARRQRANGRGDPEQAPPSRA
jgi:hypothetical protein